MQRHLQGDRMGEVLKKTYRGCYGLLEDGEAHGPLCKPLCTSKLLQNAVATYFQFLVAVNITLPLKRAATGLPRLRCYNALVWKPLHKAAVFWLIGFVGQNTDNLHSA